MLNPEFERQLNELSRTLVGAVAETWADCYFDVVTENQSPPTSDPGEWPHRDTGVGSESIDWSVEGTGDEVQGAFGVTEAGIHLFFLSHGRDPSGRLFGRLGMDSVPGICQSETRQNAERAVNNAG